MSRNTKRQAKTPAPPSSMAATKRRLQPAVTGEPPVPPRTRRRLRRFEGVVIQPENNSSRAATNCAECNMLLPNNLQKSDAPLDFLARREALIEERAFPLD